MTDDIEPGPCFGCNKETGPDGYCFGCEKHICESCDTGNFNACGFGHDPMDHLVELCPECNEDMCGCDDA